MSRLLRMISPRPFVGTVALLGLSQAALAQSTQSLVLAFDDNFAVPLSPWSSVAIAVVIAACALVFLRRRGASRFAQWCLLAATGGVLAVMQATPEAGAITSVVLLTKSPATVSPISCPSPSSTLTFQNATGHATTIRGISLTPPNGGCTLAGAPPAAANVTLQGSATPCTVGQVIADAGQCYVTLFPNNT